ncbi:MAG TPA: hypothetical protein VJ276_25750 [Thermoanaerobaculia bacterium]|nr:hypothetical protein [Thermoanaerobaculia bacterium]
MGDTNVETVRCHYFNFKYDDEQMIDGWELPQFDPADSTGDIAQACLGLTSGTRGKSP